MATQAPPAGVARIHEVRISASGQVDSERVFLKRQRRDTVRWTAEGGPWRITFDKGDGTPFVNTAGQDQGTFDIPENGSIDTREARGTPPERKIYRYRVRRGTNPFEETQDPDVDVE